MPRVSQDAEPQAQTANPPQNGEVWLLNDFTSHLPCWQGKKHFPPPSKDPGLWLLQYQPPALLWQGPVASVAGPGLTPLFAPHPAQQEKIEHRQAFRHKAPGLAPHPVLPAGLIRHISFPCRPCLLYSLKPSQLKHRPGKSIQDGFVSLISTAGSKSLKEGGKVFHFCGWNKR